MENVGVSGRVSREGFWENSLPSSQGYWKNLGFGSCKIKVHRLPDCCLGASVWSFFGEHLHLRASKGILNGSPCFPLHYVLLLLLMGRNSLLLRLHVIRSDQPG